MKKNVLLIEDDPGMIEGLRRSLSRYGEIEILEANDAGEALNKLESTEVAAVVLDLMMPYGDVRGRVEPDPQELNTGIRLLEWMQRRAPEQQPRWIAVITARSGMAVGVLTRKLLDGRGSLYLKPFNTLQFEDELVKAIGVPSKVPPDLLGATLGSE